MKVDPVFNANSKCLLKPGGEKKKKQKNHQQQRSIQVAIKIVFDK